MKASWVIGIVMLFIVGALISGVVELTFLGGSADAEAVLTRLFTMPSLVGLNVVTGAWAVLVATWEWLQAFWDLLWWNYAFFEGAYSIVRYVICFPISIGMIYGIFSVMRGNSA